MPDPDRPRLRADVTIVTIDDAGIAYDPADNELHFLSPTACVVAQLCDGTATVEETSAEIAAANGAPVEQVGAGVRATVQELGDQGLLEGVAPPPGEVVAPEVLADMRDHIRTNVPRST